MTPKPLEPFEFGVLRDQGIRATLRGGFRSGQLLSCEYQGVQWCRRAMESAEQMEKRVCADLREMLCTKQIDNEGSSFVESGAL
jgi:hypothetical protein